MRRSAKFLLLGLLLIPLWIIVFSIDGSRTETTPLGHGLSVRERYDVLRSPYSGIADGGRAIYWPIPGRVDMIQEQQLLRHDRVLWKGNAQTGTPRVFHPSPDGATVLVEGQGYTTPWEIVDTATGRTLRVPAPEIDGHVYVYPLVFEDWLPDSSGVIGKAEGMDFRTSARYRETWRVDARTGEAHRLQRTEQP